MKQHGFSRLPRHIGLIPDGNRRWAEKIGYSKDQGYRFGIAPGLAFYEACLDLGIEEITYYGFTQDNAKRPSIQRLAFQEACVHSVALLAERDADLLVVGNTASPMFPQELLPYAVRRTRFGIGGIKVNFLVNYSWQWDLLQAIAAQGSCGRKSLDAIGSGDISRIDLVMRWGGRRRLSGFLPVQTIYSDFYVTEVLWPDFVPEQLYQGLDWYQQQDITLGG